MLPKDPRHPAATAINKLIGPLYMSKYNAYVARVSTLGHNIIMKIGYFGAVLQKFFVLYQLLLGEYKL